MGEIYKKQIVNANQMVESLLEQFKKVDYDNTRQINQVQFKQLMQNLEIKINDQEIEHVFKVLSVIFSKLIVITVEE